MVNASLLPKFLEGLNDDMVQEWVSTYRNVFANYGQDLARIAANRRLLQMLEEQNIVADIPENLEETADGSIAAEETTETETPKSPIRITFEISQDGQFIKRDADGNDYIDLVLQDTLGDLDGIVWTEELLKDWAEQINSGKVKCFGTDDNHDYYDLITSMYSDPEIIKQKILELKEQNSIAKGVRAVVDKGRLWMKAIVDKRYKKALSNSKVSIEAYANPGNVKTKAELLGFSFLAQNSQAACPRAGVVA